MSKSPRLAFFLALLSAPLPLRAAAVSILHFEPAPPELGAEVAAVHRSGGMTLSIGPATATLAFRSEAGNELVRLSFGSASRASVSLEDRLPGVSHYLIGNDPRRFRTNVPRYARVRLTEVWPGIDVVFHGEGGGLEYDLLVRPEADLSAVAVSVEGASSLSISKDGELVLGLSCGSLVQKAPNVFQEIGGVRQDVPGRFVLTPEGYGFEAEAADPSAALVVDPYLGWVAILGGAASDRLNGVTSDAEGNVYVVGTTSSNDYPGEGASTLAFGGLTDAVVTKLDSGGQVLWSTFLGGSGGENGYGIGRDAAGNVWVAGDTTSPAFPIVGGFQPALSAPPDAFVAVLSPSGANLVFSTYLGGNGLDAALAIHVGESSASVAGHTTSTSFPTKNASQSAPGGGRDAFVTRISRLTGLVFSSYLGGPGDESARGVAVDPAGWTHVGGGTRSTSFPQLRPALPSFVSGQDAFLSSYDETGGLVASSTFGGSGDEEVRAVASGPDGSICIAGSSSSRDFPMTGSIQPVLGGEADAFVLKLGPQAAFVAWSTFLGGEGPDFANAVAVDGADGSVLVAGNRAYSVYGYSSTFPTAFPLQTLHDLAGPQAFLVRLTSGGALPFASLLGGWGEDEGLAVTAGPAGAAILVGRTTSVGFPDMVYGSGNENGYVVRVASGGVSDLSVEVTGPASLTSGQGATFKVKVTNPASVSVPVVVHAAADAWEVRFGQLEPPTGWACGYQSGTEPCETIRLPPGTTTLDLLATAPTLCSTPQVMTVTAVVSSPSTADPDLGNNVASKPVLVSSGLPATAVLAGSASLPCTGGTAQLNVTLTSGALPASVRVDGTDGTSWYVYLQDETTATLAVTTDRTTTYTIQSMYSAGCPQAGGGNGQAVVEVASDTEAPTVTPSPANRVELQTLCQGGAPGAYVSFGGPSSWVTDACDLHPRYVGPVVDGTALSPSAYTFLAAGTHSVVHRFRDIQGNIGSGNQTLTVVKVGDLNHDGSVDIHDVVILASYLVGNVVPGSPPFLATPASADLDRNSKVELFDLVQLQAHVVGNVGCLR